MYVKKQRESIIYFRFVFLLMICVVKPVFPHVLTRRHSRGLCYDRLCLVASLIKRSAKGVTVDHTRTSLGGVRKITVLPLDVAHIWMKMKMMTGVRWLCIAYGTVASVIVTA